MMRVLKLVVLPWVVGLLVAGGLGWWLTPRPREMPVSAKQRYALEFNAEGTLCVIMERVDDNRAELVLWDVIGSQEVWRIECAGGRLATNGQFLTWTGGGEKELVVRIFDPQTRLVEEVFKRHVGEITLPQFTPDGKTVAWMTNQDPTQVEVWDIPTGRRRLSISLNSSLATRQLLYSLSDDGSLLAAVDGLQVDMSKATDPVRVLLYDARTGELRDRWELDKGRSGYVYFERGTTVLELREHSFTLTESNSATGQLGTPMTPVTGVKYFDLRTGPRFTEPRLALARGSNGDLWVTGTTLRGGTQWTSGGRDSPTIQIDSAGGTVLGRPRTAGMHDALFGPVLIPASTSYVARTERGRGYPQWAWTAARWLGLSLDVQMFEEAILVDWQTGSQQVLLSNVQQTSRQHHGLSVLVSPNGRVLCLTCDTADGFRTEFWDFPLSVRPWWLITTSAVLATLLIFVLLSWPRRRRAKPTQTALMSPVAT